jgi:hypothetical protein
MGTWLKRGVVAGLIGAVAAAAVLLLLGERSISDAIALEEAASHGHAEEPLFSRPVQVAGGVTGLLLAGAAYGAILGVVFAAVRHRLPGKDDWYRAVRLAGLAFVAVFLVPFLKYPANPPAVGDPDTVDERTILYLLMVACSVLALWLAAQLADALRTRFAEDGPRLTVAVAVWAAIIGVCFAVLPGNPDDVSIPATLLWRFRIASAGGALAFWATAGTAFGLLCLRAARARDERPLSVS